MIGFVAALTERLKGLVVDDAVKPGVHVGPVVDESQLDQDLRYLTIGKDEGARLHWGGELLNRETPGFYLQPAVVHRGDQLDAHRARGDFRTGRQRHSRQELRRGAG